MRRLCAAALALAALCSFQAAPAPAQPSPLQRNLARALRVPHVSPARSAALAIDLSTGRTLFAQNDALPLEPASNEKLPLTYALLATLGPSYRIETDVLGEGQQEGTLWRGDLVVKGYGDPKLSSAGLRQLAAQVRSAGIRRVSGEVAGDETWFDARRTGPGWKPSFYINESPPLSALTVDRDRVHGWIARNPALGAAIAFRDALRAQGITVAGPSSTRAADDLAVPLAAIESPPLGALVRSMDRESDNFTAEILLKELGAVESGRGTTAAGAAVVAQTLADAGVPLAGVRIADGSGLSRLDRLTADALVALLKETWAQPTLRSAFLAALPVAGLNGTLQDRMRRPPARGNVVAKTGTTSEASALSGYVRRHYAFAVLQNGSPLPYWWARVAQDRFATILAAH